MVGLTVSGNVCTAYGSVNQAGIIKQLTRLVGRMAFLSHYLEVKWLPPVLTGSQIQPLKLTGALATLPLAMVRRVLPGITPKPSAGISFRIGKM